MIFLETERLILRSLQPSDIEELYDYRNNQDCIRYQRGQMRERADLEALIVRRKDDEFLPEGKKQLAIALKDGTLIGEITIFNEDGPITMGYTVSYKHHRKGYAFEMISAIVDALHQGYPEKEFLCFVELENIASLNLLNKLGYAKIGFDAEENAVVLGKYSHPETLKKYWLAEEKIAHIHGWDFSHIDGRYCEEDNLSWDYKEEILRYLTPEMKLLDIDTGGGEFLLSLNHPYHNAAATEGYAPNVELCRRQLSPLGIDFREADGKGTLPFSDKSFDMVINRHGDFNADEIYRVLKPGGIFVTQQVGAENDRELVELLMGDMEFPFPHQHFKAIWQKFRAAGFSSLLRGEEVFTSIRFFDIGALVWFARIIEWEFPGFSVESHFENLLNAQKILEKYGFVEGRIHRIFLSVQKPHQTLIHHYEGLLESGNDPVLDSPVLQSYMDKWDGAEFLEKMNLTPESEVLEIGVGTGRLALRVAPLCGKLTGIDLSPNTLERAKEHLKECRNVALRLGDFYTYFFNTHFDVIYSSLTFQHLPWKRAAIDKIVSLLNIGGRFVLSLDKNRDTVLDAGHGQVTVYPDNPDEIMRYLQRHTDMTVKFYETEFATVIVAKKVRMID